MRELIDLHTHTLASGHAYSTVKENIDMARERNIKYLGTSDHTPNMPGGPHLFHFYNLRAVPREVDGVINLIGAEVNIIDYDGNLDFSDEDLKGLDYAIVSLHTPCIIPGSIEENTTAVINAIKKPNVKIIGHLDDSRFPVDYEIVVKEAKENGVLLEINNSSLKANGFRVGARENATKMLNVCKKLNAKVIFGSDSHICYNIGAFDNCRRLIEEVNFPKRLIVNYNEEDIKSIFNI